MATKKIHPNCGPCALCAKTKFSYSHPCEWNQIQQNFIRATCSGITMTSCICKACVLDIKRNLNNPMYRPKREKPKPSCKVPGCKSGSVKACKIADTAAITQLLKLKQQSEGSITLCTDHYNIVYRSLTHNIPLFAHLRCKICSKQLTKGTDYHHCPNPNKITKYLAETTGWDTPIAREDIICITCYKSHIAILEEEELKSYDSDLITLIGELEQEQASTPLEQALIDVTIKVADALLRQDAILLPDARDMLINQLNHDHTDEVSGKFLFSYLKQRLNKHLACCTKVRSVGTLLYRKGGDLTTTITNLLSRQRKQAKEQKIVPTSKPPTADEQDVFEQLLERVCVKMNKKVHEQARKLIADSKAGKVDLTQLDIDKFIGSTDPSLWKMLLLLTRSVRDTSQSLATFTASSTKKVHCFYILCVLLFTTNNQCSTPVHVTLTDLLDSHIGNSEKIRILNRLGAVASSDTHARYRQNIVQQTKERGNKELKKKSVILSLDNIDYLQSHAAVFSGDQHRSWHGTTIQALALSKTQGLTASLSHQPADLSQSDQFPSPAKETIVSQSCLTQSLVKPVGLSHSGPPPSLVEAAGHSHSVLPPSLVEAAGVSHSHLNPSLVKTASLSHSGPNPLLVKIDSLSHSGPLVEAASLSLSRLNPSLDKRASLSHSGPPVEAASLSHSDSPPPQAEAASLSHSVLPPSLVEAAGVSHSRLNPSLVKTASLSHSGLNPLLVKTASLSHLSPLVEADSLSHSGPLPSQAGLSHSGPPPSQASLSHSGPPPSQAEAASLSHSGPPPSQASLSHSGPPPSQASLSHSGPPPSQASLSHSGPPPSVAEAVTCSPSHSGPPPSQAEAASPSHSRPNPSLVETAGLSHSLLAQQVDEVAGISHSSLAEVGSSSSSLAEVVSLGQPPSLAEAVPLDLTPSLPQQAVDSILPEAHKTPDTQVRMNRKRARTENEYGNADEVYGYKVHAIEAKASLSYYSQHQHHSIAHYNHTPSESDAFTQHKSKMFSYMMVRSEMCDSNETAPQLVIKGLQGYLSCISVNQSVETSEATYLRVMDQNADSPETILEALSWLHQEFDVGNSVDHLIVAGDAKTYLHMTTLKQQYGEALQWLITLPGDFHLLRNYQEVMMTAYWDAGLKQIAAASGYRGETLTSLSKCSNFSNTTTFFFEVWEALYQHMLKVYTMFNNEQRDSDTDQLHSGLDSFMEFLNKRASEDENWKFWTQFVLRDCMAFISLYLAVRSNDWNLRIASLKDMAPIFFAFNRPHYQKLISQHLSDLLIMPNDVLAKLKAGGFAASISGRPWHSVAIDEAHEMLINKDLKSSVTRPSRETMNRISLYLGHRIKVIKNLQAQVHQGQDKNQTDDGSIYTADKTTFKSLQNVQAMLKKIVEGELLPLTSSITTLRNPFVNKLANSEQREDLLNFRQNGLSDFHTYIMYTYLKPSSVALTLKRKTVHTFSDQKVSKKLSNSEKEKKIVSLCLKRRLKAKCIPATGKCEQYLELPRAIATSDGMPQKGDKANARSYLDRRYQIQLQDNGWTPDTVIIDGMFLIYTNPIPNTKMADYVLFLIARYVVHYLQKGVCDIHIIFDNPGRFADHPKCIEHEQRDSRFVGHQTHYTFDDNAKAPSKWSEVLKCRDCKRAAVKYIGDGILRKVSTFLTNNQRIFVAGHCDGKEGDLAYYTNRTISNAIDATLTCNAEEADTRMWLHASKTSGEKILVYSPDTDALFISLLMVNPIVKDVCLQVNPLGKPKQVLSITQLIEALKNDPYLRCIPEEDRPASLASLYILSGCDYTSFFVGYGKASFMKALFDHASFISADTPKTPGSLARLTAESGFLAWLRLVGTVYFQKHKSAFPNHTSPQSLFTALPSPNTTTNEQHYRFIEVIRSTIWERVVFEDNLIPSPDALKLHYQRACWVMNYWKQSPSNDMHPLPITSYGWRKETTTVQVKWDSEVNLREIRDRVTFLMRGCTCKKSKCETKQCSCVKNNKPCGPGCSCCNCHNGEGDHSEKSNSSTDDAVEKPPPQIAAELEEQQRSSDEDTDSDEERIEEELIFMDLANMNIVDLC